MRKASPIPKVKTSFSIVASSAGELSGCDSSAEVETRAEGEGEINTVMTDEELRGRLIVLEVFCVSALGIIFAMTGGNDPKHRKAIATLNGLQEAAKRRLSEANDPSLVEPGERYLDELLSELSENLGLLRPKPKGP